MFGTEKVNIIATWTWTQTIFWTTPLTLSHIVPIISKYDVFLISQQVLAI